MKDTPRYPIPYRRLAAALLYLGALTSAPVRALEVELPMETASYAASTLPGFSLAQRHCLTCHSSHYASTQPGTSNHAFWLASVKKMRDTFGATFPEADIEPIAEYLSYTYGADRGKPLPERAPPTVAGVAGGTAKTAPGTRDVRALLEDNACTGCHQRDQKLVGPAFRDVAARYAGQADAVQQLVAHIRDGSTGRWGAVPMPGQPDISPQDLETLARWVLEQRPR